MHLDVFGGKYVLETTATVYAIIYSSPLKVFFCPLYLFFFFIIICVCVRRTLNIRSAPLAQKKKKKSVRDNNVVYRHYAVQELSRINSSCITETVAVVYNLGLLA